SCPRRRVADTTPFGPRTVVERHVRMVDQVQRQSEHRRGDARATTGHDRLRQVDTGLAEAVGEGRRGQQGLALGIEQVREWNIAAAGDMAAAQSGPRLLLAAVETAGGAGSDGLRAL